jgi:predicted PurR-regulated permease PerM
VPFFFAGNAEKRLCRAGREGVLKTEQWLKKAGRVSAWAGLALAGGILVWAAVRWVLPLCMPFFVAFGLAFLLRRPVRFVARTAGIRRRPAA